MIQDLRNPAIWRKSVLRSGGTWVKLFEEAGLCSKIWTSQKNAEGDTAKTTSADSLDEISNPV